MLFSNWLQNRQSTACLSGIPRKRRRHVPQEADTHRSSLEPLEGRCLFSFTWAGDFPVGLNPQTIVTGDFNHDGNLDLAAADPVAGTIGVLLGDGLGGFGAARQSAIGTGLSSLAVADFNNDGNLDLATISDDVWGASILLGKGDGTFQSPINVTNNAPFQAMAV